MDVILTYNGTPATSVLMQGDCLDLLQEHPMNSFDLCFCSPPYEDRRKNSCALSGDDWVEWALPRFVQCCRVTRGLVAWVIEGSTRRFRWSATPVLLMAELHRAGVHLRKPPIFHRVGIPGSGGPDWWRNDYEFIVCASNGRLPWSDNTASGKPCKYGPGGAPTNRQQDGQRLRGSYKPPRLANPGNVIHCTVGGGQMGDELAHENEAPFPEALVEPFIKCFCPPGGIVLDPFMGSGTTLAVAKKLGRNGVGIDLRQSQIDLAERRLQCLQR